MYPSPTDLRPSQIDVDHGPLAVGTLDVETGTLQLRPSSDPTASPSHVFALLRHRQWPLGVELLPLGDPDLIRQVSSQLLAETTESSSRHTEPHRPLSVVVCTRNRPDHLAWLLRRLVADIDPSHELIVIDNAPIDDATARVVEPFGSRVRHVVEPRPGLARARNCGLRAVSNRFVVFTDDDIEPEPSWLTVVGATFAAHPGSVCVSGSVLPMSLATAAELRFQEFGGYVSDFIETAYHLTMDPVPSKLFPFHPRLLGTGANMAFRVEALRSIGGFDEALGAGTASRGGEDIDVAVRLLQAGHLIVRQPASVVWHESLTTEAELSRQIEGYGCGLTAAITKFLSHPETLFPVLRRVPVGLRTAFSDHSVKNERRSSTYPTELRRAEFRGMVKGVFAYHRVRRRQRLEAAEALA